MRTARPAHATVTPETAAEKLESTILRIRRNEGTKTFDLDTLTNAYQRVVNCEGTRSTQPPAMVKKAMKILVKNGRCSEKNGKFTVEVRRYAAVKEEEEEAPKRGRGRPRKTEDTETPKRGPGRPKGSKNKTKTETVA